MHKNQKSNSNITSYPLSHPQKRVWYTEQLYGTTTIFNIGGGILFDGVIDLQILKKAIKQTVKQNDAIFTQLEVRDGVPYQYILESRKFDLELFDFSKENNPRHSYNNWVTKKSSKPFQLINSPLFFIGLLKIDDTHTGYFLHFHHIIADGWAINLFTEQVSKFYFQFKNSGNSQLFSDKKRYSYISYLSEENNYLKSPRFEKDMIFWKSKYKTIPDFVGLLGKSKKSLSKRKTFHLKKSVSCAIRVWCKQNHFSVPIFFSSMYSLLLGSFYQKDNVVIGMPILNRNKVTIGVFGMFISTIPIRTKINSDETINDFIRRSAKETKSCLIHQKYPYDLLVSDLELRKKGLEGLFDFSFNYYNSHMVNRYDDIRVRNEEYHSGEQVYAMQMLVHEWSDDDTMSVSFDYKLSLFNERIINSFYDCLTVLIHQALFDTHKEISKLKLISPSTEAELLQYYNYTNSPFPQDKTVIDLFEGQVVVKPKAIAISCANEQLTYAELSQQINQFATLLQKQNINKNDIIAIMANHSIELVVAIFSVLKIGCTFLLIDKSYPEERIKFMLDDVDVSLLITDQLQLAQSCFKGAVIDINSYVNCKASFVSLDGTLAKKKAYIIFTSGSTGKPKGVVVEHKSLMNYICWAKEMYLLDDNEVFAFYSSISFDLTITSIFTPLVSGVECRIFTKEKDEYLLYTILKEKKATIIKLTPSHLRLLTDLDIEQSTIRTLILGGEQLLTDDAKKISNKLKGIRIFNEYGPTEATVGCMIHKFDSAIDTKDAVPIGIPISNTQLYVLNRQMQLVPKGAYGELYISGVGVSRGYYNKNELTAKKFIESPFHKDKKLYKTGDIVRYKEGILVFENRNDKQVKINGYRIEVEELERNLNKIAGVKNSVVTVTSNSEQSLSAFVETSKNITINYIEEKLRTELPSYMIPERLIIIPKIPLTKSGKVNYKQLPIPKEITVNVEDYDLNKFDLIEICFTAIKKVLNIKKVHLKDNFFMLGGDSISAIQLTHALKLHRIIISVTDILDNPLIKNMVTVMKIKNNNALQTNSVGEVLPTPITQWFSKYNHNVPGYYHQSVVFEISSEINNTILKAAFKQLIDFHDTLRLFYDNQKHVLYYQNDFHNTFEIKTYDVSNIPIDEQNETIRTIAIEEKEHIQLARSPLFKVLFFRCDSKNNKLILIAHHHIIDAVSWSIILKDLTTLIQALKSKKEINLGIKSTSIKEWSEQLRNKEIKEILTKEKGYWDGLNSVTMFDSDIEYYKKENNLRESCIIESIVCDGNRTKNIIKNAHKAYNTKNDELLRIALALTLADFHKKNTVVYLTESNGRNQLVNIVDVGLTIGWFTAIYPTVLTINQSDDLSEIIKTSKESLRNVPNGGIGYGVLKYIYNKIERNVPDYIFNYLGDVNQLVSDEVFQLSKIDTGPDVSFQNSFTDIMEMNAMILDKQLVVECMFSPLFFSESRAKEFLNLFYEKIIELEMHCMNKKEREISASDFDTVRLSEKELNTLFS